MLSDSLAIERSAVPRYNPGPLQIETPFALPARASLGRDDSSARPVPPRSPLHIGGVGAIAFYFGSGRLGDHGDNRLRRLEVAACLFKLAQGLRPETFPLERGADHNESCLAWRNDDILVLALLRLFRGRFLGKPAAPYEKKARLGLLGVGAGDEI